MALSDTKIHQIELLLTLDYLLRHTDQEHPATQIDICNHARKYGLRFDKNAKQGNQVRRQRIGECLRFLEEIANHFPDDVPFVLETTDSGKYYIEQRNGLDEEQVAKILAAIKNDKYTKDEDVDFLIERILDAFGTDDENKRLINKAYKRLIRGEKKYDKETIRKINLIEKAYQESKMVKIQYRITDQEKDQIITYCFWYRVYLIKEFHNELYALLLPIGQMDMDERYGKLLLFKPYLFEPIERLNIAQDNEKNVLCDDFDDNRDFNKLFHEKCPDLAKEYGDIDNWIENEILPSEMGTSMVSFYFDLGVKDVLAKSFENYFSEEMHYQETNLIAGLEKNIEDYIGAANNWLIITDEPEEKEKPKYGLVNFSVNRSLFCSWLLSDPHNQGRVCIADMIIIIKPHSLNEYLARYFYHKLMKRMEFLPSNKKERLFNELSKNSI